MNVTQRIARNTAVLTVAEVVTAVINLFFTMYVARYLGAQGFGVLSFALALIAIFSVLTDMGLNPLITREIARDKTTTEKYLGNVIAIKIILSVLTFGLIVLTINVLRYPQQTVNVVYLLSISLVLDTFSLMFYSFFRGFEKMEFVTLGRTLNACLLLTGALFAINQRLPVNAFAFMYVAASAVTMICNISIANWKLSKPRIESDLRFWKAILNQAWPLGLIGIFTSIYFWISSVMLSFFKGEEAVGWFNTAYRLVFALAIIPGVYFTAIFPVMSRFHVSARDSLQFLYERSIKYMLILAVPIALGTSVLANKAILLIFGEQFSNSIIVLQILVWAVAFIFVSTGILQLFVTTNQQTIATRVTGGCALINVVLNLILIPKFSYIGASFATVATELCALSIVVIWSSKIGYGISWRRTLDVLAKILVAGAIMGTFVYYLRDLILWILIPLSALLYFIVLFIIKGIDSEDRLLLRQMVNRKST